MLVAKDPDRIEARLSSTPAPAEYAPKPLPLCGPFGASRKAPPERIHIVADDLTGACDSAVVFLASGRSVHVRLDARSSADASDVADVVAVSTGSRDLQAEQAESHIPGFISHLRPVSPGALLFTKIDSAARGNPVAEIMAALRTSSAALALVTPALPDAGRTVSGGILSIRDWSGQNTTTDLRNLFREGGVANASVLGAASEQELFRAMVRAIESGVGVLLCDAAAQRDLDRLAAAALQLPQPVLWAGSAGFARALAAQLPARSRASGPPRRRTGQTLLFTGTPHPVTALQIAHLESCSSSALHSHPRTIHRLGGTRATHESIVPVFSTESHAALILTGGKTATYVLRALGATGIRLGGEVATGIPWGILEGGLADGCTVVTKSGGFGERDALLRAFEFCESDICGPEVLPSQ